MGGNPEGGCGTVQLTGTYLSVTFTATDTDVSLVGGDGFAWTMSAASPVPAYAEPAWAKRVEPAPWPAPAPWPHELHADDAAAPSRASGDEPTESHDPQLFGA